MQLPHTWVETAALINQNLSANPAAPMFHLHLILSHSMTLRLGQPVLKIFPKSKAVESDVFLVTKRHQFRIYATVAPPMWNKLPKYSRNVFIQMLLEIIDTCFYFFPLKVSCCNSADHNLACPSIEKYIDTIKSFKIKMKMPISRLIHQYRICATVAPRMWSRLPKYSRNVFIHIIEDYRHMLSHKMK